MHLLHRKAQSYKFSNKNDLFCAWRDFSKTFCGISTYHKWIFKLQISSIFNFEYVNEVWINGVLDVKVKFVGLFKLTLTEWILEFVWNYVDKILASFHHLLCVYILYGWQKSGHFWTTYPLRLVNVVCERPLMGMEWLQKFLKIQDSKFQNWLLDPVSKI